MGHPSSMSSLCDLGVAIEKKGGSLDDDKTLALEKLVKLTLQAANKIVAKDFYTK